MRRENECRGIKAAVGSLYRSIRIGALLLSAQHAVRPRSLARSLHSLWVTLLSGPAHVVSVREERRCNDTSVRQLAAAADFTAEGERRDGEKRRERRSARRGTHAHSLAKVGGESGPTHSLAHPTTYLPSCPRSHAHIAHGDRAITSMSSLDAARLGLPGAPLPSPLSKHLYGKKGDARIERWPGRKSTSWDVESGPWECFYND